MLFWAEGLKAVPLQEEPKNMGPWSYVWPRLATALRELTPEGFGVPQDVARWGCRICRIPSRMGDGDYEVFLSEISFVTCIFELPAFFVCEYIHDMCVWSILNLHLYIVIFLAWWVSCIIGSYDLICRCCFPAQDCIKWSTQFLLTMHTWAIRNTMLILYSRGLYHLIG